MIIQQVSEGQFRLMSIGQIRDAQPFEVVTEDGRVLNDFDAYSIFCDAQPPGIDERCAASSLDSDDWDASRQEWEEDRAARGMISGYGAPPVRA